MEQRISLITLGVRDFAASLAFYQRLGWRKAPIEADGVAFFQAGGMLFSLYPREELASDAQVPAEGTGFRGFSLAYNTRTKPEVDLVLAQAESAGAKIVKPAQDAFWGGYSGYFADPDGFLWEVAWNPGFEIADDGSVSIPE
jgi:catechol 2,3-dioxygenase-like lactoylglutathione lyase family enzyme